MKRLLFLLALPVAAAFGAVAITPEPVATTAVVYQKTPAGVVATGMSATLADAGPRPKSGARLAYARVFLTKPTAVIVTVKVGDETLTAFSDTITPGADGVAAVTVRTQVQDSLKPEHIPAAPKPESPLEETTP